MRPELRVSASDRPARRSAARGAARWPRARAKSALVALDSDGTVFDSMGPKHEACFAPAFVSHFASGASPELLRRIWRFVNLESRSRGINRYRALVQALRLLACHPEAGSVRPLWLRSVEALESWLADEPSPSRPSLETELRKGTGRSRALSPIFEWSSEVDAAIAGLPPPRPFPAAIAALPALSEDAEIVILTAAPEAAVRAEWEGAGILCLSTTLLGQERGPKGRALAAYAAQGAAEGRFPEDRLLVVGDAPGDLEAARSVGAAFYPIIQGREEACWQAFAETGLERFLSGERSPGRGLLAGFLAALPLDPPWRSRCS